MTPKRKYTAPAYITERLAELALLKPGWYRSSHPNQRGRKILRTSLHAAHQRFREYDGPTVHLYPMIDGRIHAEFEMTIRGHQHEDEIL